jgi:hypothetical protein
VADGGVQPSRPVTPTPPSLATATTYAPSPLPTYTPAQISKGIISNESGGRNVVSPQGARGPGQIMPATFRQYAKPGENIDNPADNMAVHNRIIADYSARWPNDPARVAVAYFSGPGNVSPPGSPTPWIRNVGDVNESVAKYVANATAKMGGPAGGTATATTTPATAAPQPAGVGNAIAALNMPTGARSTADNLSSALGGGGGGESAPPMNLEGQQAAAAGGNARQQMLAMQGAQMAAALRARPGLQGVPGPNSSPTVMGGAMIPMPTPVATPGSPTPGTTLNSAGGLYG